VKILLDENCAHLAGRLKTFGWDATIVNDVLDRPAGQPSVSDDRIMRYAIENKYVIITRDKGLYLNCRAENTPCVNLSFLYDEVKLIDSKLKEMIAWKDFI
jgi:predicted nuclease of predicted toxin-antitoxin system